MKDTQWLRLVAYVKRGRPTANATINREIDALRRAWNLAREHEPPLIYRSFPKIEDLPEDNIRRDGRIEAIERLKALRATMPQVPLAELLSMRHEGHKH